MDKLYIAIFGLFLGWTGWVSLTIVENQNKIIEMNGKIDVKVEEAKAKLGLIDYKLDEIAKDLYGKVNQ